MRFYLVDAFTTGQARSGNPAAVVILDGASDWPDEGWLQGLGTEFNQAETAFVLPTGSAGRFGLRWFTPVAEVDLCGHATVGATRALLAAGLVGQDEEVVFDTKSGALVCLGVEDRVSMDFPIFSFDEVDEPLRMGFEATFWGSNGMDWMAVLDSEAAVRRFEPDFEAIAGLGQRGLILTAKGDGNFGRHDYVLRFFAPAFGVPEDHVTGSAHCCVGPYWAQAFGTVSAVGYQASPRGGLVISEMNGERVQLSGDCRLVVSGVLDEGERPF